MRADVKPRDRRSLACGMRRPWRRPTAPPSHAGDLTVADQGSRPGQGAEFYRVAGLAELRPWLEQRHGEVDPAYGLSLAAFCRDQLTARAAQVGKTAGELAAWRPVAPARGRRPRVGRPVQA